MIFILKERTYIIEVFTGDLPESGTNANVFFTIYGENSDLGEIELAESKTHLNKFERNQVDKFVIVSQKDLGYLNSIKIRHDNKGVMPDWYLSKVIITEKEAKKKFTFLCGKWLSTNKDDCKIERIIKEAVFFYFFKFVKLFD